MLDHASARGIAQKGWDIAGGVPPVPGEACAARDGDPGAVSADEGTGALPSPLSLFAAGLGEARSADVLEMDAVGRLLAELAADDEFFGPLIADMASRVDGRALAAQARTGSSPGACAPA